MNEIAKRTYDLYLLREDSFFNYAWKEFAACPQAMQAIVLLTLKWKKGSPYVLLNPKKEEEHAVIFPEEFVPARKSSIGAGANFAAPFQVVICAKTDQALAPFLRSYTLHAGVKDEGDQSIVANGIFAIEQSFLAYPEPSLYRWCFSIDADAMVLCRCPELARLQTSVEEPCAMAGPSGKMPLETANPPPARVRPVPPPRP